MEPRRSVERRTYREPFFAKRGSEAGDVPDALSTRHLFRPREHHFDQGGNLNGMRRVPRRAAEAMERLKELELLTPQR